MGSNGIERAAGSGLAARDATADVFASWPRCVWASFATLWHGGQKGGHDSYVPLEWSSLVFASTPRPALPQREKFSLRSFLALDQLLEVVKVLFEPLRKTRGIESGTYF